MLAKKMPGRVGATGVVNTLADVLGRSSQFVRPRLQLLDDAGIIETVTRKPLRFRLTQRVAALLDLEGP